MDARIGGAVADILRARPTDLGGLLYLLLRLDGNGNVVPLYIGRAGRHGKNGTVVSVNLRSISQTTTGGWANSGKFARWGYGYSWGAARFDETASCGRDHRNRRPDRWTRTTATSPWGRRRVPRTLTLAPPPGGTGLERRNSARTKLATVTRLLR